MDKAEAGSSSTYISVRVFSRYILKQGRFFIGVLLSISIVIYMLSIVDIDNAFRSLRLIRPFWLAPLALTLFLSFYLRALRWQAILKSVKRISFFSSYCGISIGGMFNMLIPFKIGELIRGHVLSKQESIPYSSVLSSIVIDRLYDILPLSLTVLYLSQQTGFFLSDFLHIHPHIQIFMVAFAAAALVSAIGFLIWKTVRPEAPDNDLIETGMPRFFRQPVSRAISVLMRQEWKRALFYSAAIWCIYLAQYACFLKLFDLHASFLSANLLLFFTGVSILIPSGPAQIGTYHAAVIIALGMSGINTDKAAGMAIFIHAYFLVIIVMLGMISLWLERLNVKEMNQFLDQ